MTDAEKLALVLAKLKKMAIPFDEDTQEDEYWDVIDVMRDNCSLELNNNDIRVKRLIKLIEES